ncbi:hypothetical protein [Marinibacterium sp. SX1]|uniref:hypothetical protein n=1 Tax=Marinibacterium sp. SX1 TaxID=3388424 RepID=UPI003D17EB49
MPRPPLAPISAAPLHGRTSGPPLRRTARAAMLAGMGAMALALAGCIEVPALDRAGDPDVTGGDYPALIPLGPVVAASVDPVATGTELQGDLAGRVARLQGRADSLRRDEVLDPEARQRLLRQLNR